MRGGQTSPAAERRRAALAQVGRIRAFLGDRFDRAVQAEPAAERVLRRLGRGRVYTCSAFRSAVVSEDISAEYAWAVLHNDRPGSHYGAAVEAYEFGRRLREEVALVLDQD